MTKEQLLGLAISHATNMSLTECKGEKVILLFNGESEYTTCPEKNLQTVMEAEPYLKQVAIFLNGKKL